MGRRYYIPRTRSGSSMLASVLTQALDNQRKIRYAEIQKKVDAGEISEGAAFFLRHPVFCVGVACFALLMFIGLFKACLGSHY